MKNIFKLALASAMVADSQAVQTTATADIIQQALATVEQGSELRTHLESALVAAGKVSDEDRSCYVVVPIDEKHAMKLTVSPQYALDNVNSVTLKAFRKIVGYDTFDSIRRKNFNEFKDSSDFYNVTVSLLVQRKPADKASAPQRDVYSPDGTPSLAATLDKGFPYDD